MPVKLSQAAFCSLILDSGLLSQERLERLREEYLRQQKGHDAEDCLALTEFLVRKNELTLWQAKKLLQGKHRGFFIGKYKLLSLLGRGGMSSVYLAEHTMMRRRCAIKILPFKQVKNAAALSRFHREAQAVASLDDRNIVRAYDVDKLIEAGNEIHYLVMEYVDGRSLQQLVDEDGPLAVTEAAEYVRQAASGLAHAHSVGVVHRDVKPSNLLLDETGTIKVLDLGLARIYEDASEQSSLTIEHQQTVLGTADYLSPEQAVDSHGVDHRCDIYSLGCTLYFLLTGQPPFREGTLTQRLLAHQTKTPAPVTTLRPDVPETLVTILDRMMAKRPALRFQSAAALVDALTDWLGSNAGETSVNRVKEKRSQESARRQTSSAKKANVGQSRDTSRSSASTSTTRSPAGSQPPKQQSAGSTTGDSVRDGDSDENLLSFLRDLDSTIGHETVDPSFPTSDTIVTNVKSEAGDAAVVPMASSSNVLDLQIPDSKPTKVATGEPDDRSQEIVPSSIGQPRRKHSRSSSTIAAVLAGGLIAAVLVGSFVLWNSERQSSPSASKPVEQTVTESGESPAESRIEIAAGEDLRVGPDGHFPTIGEALAHVRETFHPLSPNDSVTIRVAGGQTYKERIAIDNSLSRTFPQGVRLICEDDNPAILAPDGSDPILDLRTVERFQINGFTLRGTGQPELVKLEGYLVRTILENLVLEGAGETALRGLGATGFAGPNRLILRNLTLRDPSAAAVGMRFAAGSTSTKNLLIDGCRVVGNFETGISFRGGVSGVEAAKCIFDGAATSLRFDSSPDPREDVLVTACTFRGFDAAIRVERPLTPSDGDFQFTRNLFTDASGPECVIGDGTSTGDNPPLQWTASYNWTQRPEPGSPADGEIDIFANHGRRGADITFIGVDPSQPATYLKPESSALHAASQQIPSPPRQIGAVPSAEH